MPSRAPDKLPATLKRVQIYFLFANAPSPAATSAMPIARHICDRVAHLLTGTHPEAEQ